MDLFEGGASGVELLVAPVEVLAPSIEVAELGLELALLFVYFALAFLDLAGGVLHRLLQPGEAVASLLIPLMQFAL